MPEEKTDKKAEKTEPKPGFTEPIDSGTARVPDHIDPETLMAKGIDPDTKEVKTVSLVVLQKQFGEKKGRDKYNKIAIAGGFFDPRSEPVGGSYLPDLSLEGIDSKAREKVDAVLKEA